MDPDDWRSIGRTRFPLKRLIYHSIGAIAIVFEIGHAVGFGPKSNSARSAKGIVLGREKLLAVKRDSEAVIFCPQFERMPLVGGNFGIGALDLLPPSFDHAVEADIVFESIGTDDVIVVRRGEPGDIPPAWSTFPSTGLNRIFTSTFFTETRW